MTASRPMAAHAAELAASPGPEVIRLDNVSYRFGPRAAPVIENLSLSIRSGEFVALVGPSGCGKTTLLNLLAGDMPPTAGTADIRGKTRRVFQHDGLFPWLTVRENIALAFGPGKPTDGQSAQVGEMLALVGLDAFANHYPHQLSGGMRQRVELARALSGESDIVLMDEPFSALDYLTRLRLRRELARLLTDRPRTIALVTHDIEEAAQLADRVIVLSERPARARFTLPLTAPRPREATDLAVVDAVRVLLAEMGL